MVDSHQVREAFFHLSELANTQPQKECRDADAQQETGPDKADFVPPVCTSETRR